MRQLRTKLRNQERRKYFVTALDGQIHDMIATVMLVPHNIYYSLIKLLVILTCYYLGFRVSHTSQR